MIKTFDINDNYLNLLTICVRYLQLAPSQSERNKIIRFRMNENNYNYNTKF